MLCMQQNYLSVGQASDDMQHSSSHDCCRAWPENSLGTLGASFLLQTQYESMRFALMEWIDVFEGNWAYVDIFL